MTPGDAQHENVFHNKWGYDLAIERGRYDLAALFAVRELRRVRRDAPSKEEEWRVRLVGAFTRRSRVRR